MRKIEPAIWKLWKAPEDPDELIEWITKNQVMVGELEALHLLKLMRQLNRSPVWWRKRIERS